MTEREQILTEGLRHIRATCDKPGADAEGLLRKIHQTVGFILKRAGVLETPEDAAAAIADELKAEMPEAGRYLLDLGSVQVSGQLDDAARLQGQVWLNDATVECDGLEVSLAFGKPTKVNILGVVPYAGGEAEAPDHPGQSGGP